MGKWKFPLRRSKRPRSEEGQISLLTGVMTATFLFLFAFVVNTGMLVNAKINLQNAADMAAYAGAAVQARQLTQIAYLNYEMRRQWKKFLFRIYVVGNMAYDSFPRNGGNGSMVYRPSNNANVEYGLPATCVIFSQNDNPCHVTQLNAIAVPEATYLDAVTDTLRAQLQKIEEIRQNNCKQIGLTNNLLNLYWLFNADPDHEELPASGMTPQQATAYYLIRGLSYGLGIIPREIILRRRIKTLENYVNEQRHSGVSRGMIDSNFLSQQDPARYERTVQAFLSAYYTLGNHTFDGAISMDELIPGDAGTANLLKLNDIRETFDIYGVDLDIDTASPNPTDCRAIINPISIPNGGLTLGVWKDPSMMTYYAVRLKADAKVLFSPFGPVTLKAYAAAQPFGSRIGPRPTTPGSMFTSSSGSLPGNMTGGGATSLTRKRPNLPLDTGDSTNQGAGWDTQQVVHYMFQALLDSAGAAAGTPATITSTDMDRAFAVAMAPNPWETSRYNIMTDRNVTGGPDRFVLNFAGDLTAAFWAPVFPPGLPPQAIAAEIQNEVQSLIGQAGAIQGNTGGVLANILNKLTSDLNLYISKLQAGQGEFVGIGGQREGANIARISDPYRKPTPAGTPIDIPSQLQIIETNPQATRTSWSKVNNGEYRSAGRVGYSVKIVSFDSLTAHKRSTDGSSVFNNDLFQDGEAKLEIPFIKH